MYMSVLTEHFLQYKLLQLEDTLKDSTRPRKCSNTLLLSRPLHLHRSRLCSFMNYANQAPALGKTLKFCPTVQITKQYRRKRCLFFPSSNFPKGRENISVCPCFYTVKRALVNFGRAWKVTDVSETLCQAKYICKQINPSPGLVGRNH